MKSIHRASYARLTPKAVERVVKYVLARMAALMNSIIVTKHVSSVTNWAVKLLASYTSEL